MAEDNLKFEAPKRRAKASDAEKAPASVEQLSSKDEVAARTAPDAPVDSKFHRTFVIPARDWHVDGPVDDMHRANQVATLQEALNRGLHPRGAAKFDGAEDHGGDSTALNYSVEVILATEDEDPASTFTPKFALDEMGGSTIQDAAKANKE